MSFREAGEGRGVTLRGARQFRNHLLRRMRMPMKRVARHLHSFLRGRGHGRGIIVAGRALRTRDRSKVGQTAVLLVTGRAGMVLHHIRLVKGMLLVAGLALAIDRLNRNSVSETIPQNRGKFSARGGPFVTLRAIVRELRVRGRNFSGVKKSFPTATRKKRNRQKTPENDEQADD